MPIDEVKDREAYELSEIVHSAANIMEQAVKTQDGATKKALRDAAKSLLNNAVARMDESVGASVAEEDE